MAELNECCEFSFGGHIERATLKDRSPSGARDSYTCGWWDRDSVLRTDGHEPTSYTIGTQRPCEGHHARVSLSPRTVDQCSNIHPKRGKEDRLRDVDQSEGKPKLGEGGTAFPWF